MSEIQSMLSGDVAAVDRQSLALDDAELVRRVGRDRILELCRLYCTPLSQLMDAPSAEEPQAAQ